MFKSINDLLALLIAVAVFPALWVLHGRGIIVLPGEVIGVTIAAETLIIQFYFRKAKTETPDGE